MLTENDVVNVVAEYLEGNGYSIQKKCTTSQQGIDIEAEHPNKGMCLVEVKGATSSVITSSRYGAEFDKNQVKTHVGVALLKSFQTQHEYPNATVANALPNNENHLKMIESIETPIKHSGIHVYMVNDDGTVEERILTKHSCGSSRFARSPYSSTVEPKLLLMKTEKSRSDKAIEIISKVAQDVVPFGSAAATVYEKIFRPQLARRGMEFLQGVFDKLFAVSDKEDTNLEAILRNADFAAFVTQAAQSAALTSSEEKLEALRNAVLNFAGGQDPGEDRRQIFLRAVSDLTPTHLRLLKLLQAPIEYARAHGLEFGNSGAPLQEILNQVFPDFEASLNFYEYVHAELGARGLAIERIEGGVFPNAAVKCTTNMGDELLEFVSSPLPSNNAL